MKRNSNEYMPGGKIRWCMDNNVYNYHDKGLLAPAEPEVLDILDRERSRLRALYVQECGVDFNNVTDEEQASTWIQSQSLSEAMYTALKELEKIYDIHQIVSILVAVVPSGGIGLRVVSVRQELVLQLTRQAN